MYHSTYRRESRGVRLSRLLRDVLTGILLAVGILIVHLAFTSVSIPRTADGQAAIFGMIIAVTSCLLFHFYYQDEGKLPAWCPDWWPLPLMIVILIIGATIGGANAFWVEYWGPSLAKLLRQLG